MSNSYNLAVDLTGVLTAIATVDTVVDANAVILADVHDTDLPAAKAVIDTIDAESKTTFKFEGFSTNSLTYITVIDYSGKGVIYRMFIKGRTTNNTWLKVTIDGVVSELEVTGGGVWFVYYNPLYSLTQWFENDSDNTQALNMEFKTNFKVEAKSTNAGETTNGMIHYGDN